MTSGRLSWVLTSVCLLLGGWNPQARADTFTVTTTADAGPGSLRQALDDANVHAGADTVAFNIPIVDPGYDPVTGVWTIRPASALPNVTGGGTMIDGTTQSAHQGDNNPFGPEIEIDGSSAGTTSGISILSADNMVKGLVVNRCGDIGISVQGALARNNTLIGNYVGTDATGMVARGNVYGGVRLRTGANNNRVGDGTPNGRNLISGTTSSVNLATGNGIYVQGADSNRISGNYIGVDREGRSVLRNINVGICIKECRFTLVGGTGPGEGNIISGNGWDGVVIRMLTEGHNTVSGNYIGTDATGQLDLGNASEGVCLDFGSQSNMIGPGNIIAFNGRYGVFTNQDSTLFNTVTRNSITRNRGDGIGTTQGGNGEIAPPTITLVSPSLVSGSALPNSAVEIFSDSSDEGAIYEGTALADAFGNFLWNGAAHGPNITATCTDADGNTSVFSSPVTDIEGGSHADAPVTWSLSQNYPNPFNPTTTIQYSLANRQWTTVTVFDMLGRDVVTLVDGIQQPGTHTVRFHAGALASGMYFYRIQAGDFVQIRALMLLK